MGEELPNQVDAYLEALLVGHDEALEAALRSSAEAGLPSIQVTPLQGKFLHLLAKALRAEKVLEIGTLGGYSSIWLGRAVAPKGHVTTLEVNPKHAEIARANLKRADLASVVEVVQGPALDSLAKLSKAKAGPFDLVFVDADKQGITEYVDWGIKLGHPGTVLVVDNVIREGAIIDPTSGDPNVLGVRRFLAHLSKDPRVSTTALQTVGAKKHDGFALLVVERVDAPGA